ncbi:type 1 glutamine amidotransferase [Paenibacillus sp. y28]|uniref:type 1 glutamine amidotransferase n=1 Tax=Paenibacillus sp. y28 TaxID=3129110 RepID=UPI003017018C
MKVHYVPEEPHLPPLNSFDVLVILGGPMSVYQENEFGWLIEEKQLVQKAMQAGKKVLGICFGAQMLAELLGGRVYRNEWKEIGWHEVVRTGYPHPFLKGLPERFYSYQWHGDCFDLPEGAVHLASSEACRNQAFAYGEHVLALQFHLETSPECIAEMLRRWGGELTEGPFVQEAEHIRGQISRSGDSMQYLHGILNQFIPYSRAESEVL